MTTITNTTSGRKLDASLDATLNPVTLGPNEVVAWGIAFPRPAATRPGTPSWRTDGTIPTVIALAARLPTPR